MKRLVCILLFFLPITAHGQFDVMSWTKGKLYLKTSTEEYYYFYADERTRTVAAVHRKLVGESMFLIAVHVRTADGTCYLLEPHAVNGRTTMKTRENDCARMEQILFWFAAAKKQPETVPLEKNVN
jgi:hypothetical protein